MAESTMKVLIAEDHRMTAKLLQSMLNKQENIHVVDIALDGKDVLSKLESGDIDVLLLDLEMPIMNGFEIMSEMAGQNIPARILILSAHNEKDFIEKSISLGADGYMTKGSDLDEIINALRSVFQGQSYFKNLNASVNGGFQRT